MTVPTPQPPISELLATIRGMLTTYDDHGTGMRSLISVYRLLVEALNVRAYETEEHPDTRLEQVVISVHGVDVSIRGREHDLFIHVDTIDRDADDANRYPLVLEVNNGGENEYS
jgi:hypothetical protein